MSEFINNSSKRRELLKHMILELHQGEAPSEVKIRLKELLKSIPYNEVVEVEQELISEGLPERFLNFAIFTVRFLRAPLYHNKSRYLLHTRLIPLKKRILRLRK